MLQVSTGNGIPEEHIIIMMYDDVAHNEGNPFMGKLFNTANGRDVYAGCKIDYKGADVTMANFLKVLSSPQPKVRCLIARKLTKYSSSTLTMARLGSSPFLMVQ
jgi:legumain